MSRQPGFPVYIYSRKNSQGEIEILQADNSEDLAEITEELAARGRDYIYSSNPNYREVYGQEPQNWPE